MHLTDEERQNLFSQPSQLLKKCDSLTAAELKKLGQCQPHQIRHCLILEVTELKQLLSAQDNRLEQSIQLAPTTLDDDSATLPLESKRGEKPFLTLPTSSPLKPDFIFFSPFPLLWQFVVQGLRQNIALFLLVLSPHYTNFRRADFSNVRHIKFNRYNDEWSDNPTFDFSYANFIHAEFTYRLILWAFLSRLNLDLLILLVHDSKEI